MGSHENKPVEVSRRLLWLNWRDPWHPKAGGAEVLTLRILERLAKRGWSVEWFSGMYPGADHVTERDGITFVRAGTQKTVHMNAFQRYRNASAFDIVIDEVNTIPFYAHTYIKTRAIAFFCQLAQEVWHFETPGVLGKIGAAVEPFYLRPYRKRPLITISSSSARTLREIGLRGSIDVVDVAVDEPFDSSVPSKNIGEMVLYIGRLAPSKRIEHCIQAAGALHKRGWNGRLVIAGTGEAAYVSSLKKMAAVSLGSSVVFTGFITPEERTRVLREASCLWMTSSREGWGLVVTEAARHGTPAVVYRVPGLVDAVRDGETGFVVDPNPEALADATQRLWNGPFEKFAMSALQQSSKLNWDRTALQFESIVERYIQTR